MIDVKGIKKSFGSLEVLKGIDLHIDKGEVVSIVGPSGAGKTTLFKCIKGFYDIGDGQIIYKGKESASIPEAAGSSPSPFRSRCWSAC